MLNFLIELESSLDNLEHTRNCIIEYLREGQRCHCGLEDIRDAIDKYKKNHWKEKSLE